MFLLNEKYLRSLPGLPFQSLPYRALAAAKARSPSGAWRLALTFDLPDDDLDRFSIVVMQNLLAFHFILKNSVHCPSDRRAPRGNSLMALQMPEICLLVEGRISPSNTRDWNTYSLPIT